MIEPTLSTSTPPPEEDVTTTLYRAAIGPVSNGYYLPIFTRFEAADRAGISWNMAASLLTLNWLVFRKLWVAALAYVGVLVAVALLVFGIGHLVLQFSDGLLMALGLGFGLAAFVLPGLFGNALFHAECRKAMAKALTGHTNVADARDALLAQASDRKRLITLAAMNLALLLVAAFAYLQFSVLSNVAVLPHGALDAGTITVGRTTSPPIRPVTVATAALESTVAPASTPASAATPTASATVSEAASAPIAATVPASAPATPPNAVLKASEPQASASTPASASAKAAASKPSAPRPSASRAAASAPVSPASAVTTGASASASASKTKPITQTSLKIAVAASAPAVQAPAKKSSTPLAGEAPKKAASAPTVDAAAKAFFINVGLFGVPENAAKAHAKLLEAGLPSVMKELKSKTRQIRVRVGPYGNQEQADAAVEKIKSLQLDAVIIQL